MSTRRKFIINCTALAVSATALPVSALLTSRRDIMLRFQTLAAEVNSMFMARNTSGTRHSLRLVEAASTHTPGAHFSLLFRGDATQPLNQDTYSFEHARLGHFEMFIVP